ncbi:MAG: 3-dehydroquinate synthase [Halieaceae bacterium]
MKTTDPAVNVCLNSESIDRSDPIFIESGLLSDRRLLDQLLSDRSVCLVTNTTVSELYLNRVLVTLGADRKVTTVTLPDGESFKTISSFEQVLTAALEEKHERSTVFIALGGGVVGDITGFSASAFLRGTDFIQIPTTLLAQVDSSVGGKTGINHPMGKNLIGAFHQPMAVLCDTQTLETLPDREFSAGIAEVIKYGLIADKAFFYDLIEGAVALKSRDPDVLASVIARCCAIKADIVSRDEREGGIRAILNLGHTFGHAIEKEQGFGKWLHGEAVAAGMVMATRISVSRGHVSSDVLDDLLRFLKTFDLPCAPPSGMTVERFLSAMQGDKKVQSGRIRYILLSELGEASIVQDVSESEIGACL